ncbi:keratin, type II cytoskeletal 1 [Penaeus vannamei]|uniref:keratin, type II cytoskeletal 1 n=1 Tax=Penaeus vannamei TaxID=6689 RepID=UPI00387F99FE
MANLASTVAMLLAVSAIVFLAVSNKRVNEAALANKVEVERRVAEKDDDIKNCQTSVSEKSNQISALKTKVDGVKEQVKQVQVEINPIAGVSEKEVEALSQELAALQTKFEEVNAQIAGLGSTSTLGTTV